MGALHKIVTGSLAVRLHRTFFEVPVLSAGLIFRFPEDQFLQPSHFVLIALPLFLAVRFRFMMFSRNALIGAFLLLCFAARSFFEIFVHSAEWQAILVQTLFWVVAALAVLLLSSREAREYRSQLVCFSGLFFLVSLFFGVVQLHQSGLTPRPFGLSGTPNHLAIQGVLLFLLLKLGVASMPRMSKLVLFGPLLGASRGYLIFLVTVVCGAAVRRPILGLLASIIALVTVLGLSNEFQSLALNLRMGEISSSDVVEEFSQRGFVRAYLYPEYFVFGASDTLRTFPGDEFSGLIHSTLLQVAFAYGLLGLLFVIWHLRLILRSCGFVCFLAYTAFSFTHFFHWNALFIVFVACLSGSELRRFNLRV